MKLKTLIAFALIELSMFSCFRSTGQAKASVLDTAYLQTTEYIFNSSTTTNVHASTIVGLPGGKLMSAWFGGTAEGNPDVTIWISTFQNGSWSTPVSIADGVINISTRYPCWNPVLLFSQQGTLFLFYKVGSSPGTWWGMMKTSVDTGLTWSSPITLPSGILGPIKDKPIQLANGNILCPSSMENTGWKVHLEKTNDSFTTWTKTFVDTASIYNVIQPTILRYSDSQLQMLCRSRQGLIIQSWSQDTGTTWSNFSATNLPNNNSGIDAVTLSSGLQVLVYNPLGYNGVTSYRYKLNVAVSRDGINWHDVYILENGVTGEEYSYPAVIQSADGLVHITYTWKRLKIKHVVLDVIG